MSSSTAFEPATHAEEHALRAVEPAAFVVAPRIVRRVIRHHHDLPGLQFQVPHRQVYVVDRDRLLRTVDPDELGAASAESLPDTVILIARPEEHDPVASDPERLLVHYWRLLFHARIHATFDEHFRAGRLTRAGVRRLIDRIGQTAFDEVRTVLRQESLLFSEEPDGVWTEFAATYLELRCFAPDLLSVFFPSLESNDLIDEILGDFVDVQSTFEATRPAEAPWPRETKASELGGDAPSDVAAAPPLIRRAPSERLCRRLLWRADKAALRGNNVRAAILRRRAAAFANPEEWPETGRDAAAELDRLTRRLQAALGFVDHEAAEWREALGGLLANSSRGFWNPDARLLYDLQKVCLDHERASYVVDLAGWLVSLGRRPLKRPLPNQREVLMSKHLQSAVRRLGAAQLSGTDRRRLEELLDHAVTAAEGQLRQRLRPLITAALDEVGLRPENVPERVAFRKLVEELIDKVVRDGFFNMGDLRDAVSRNQLKLPDIADASELVSGDPLLRADRCLAHRLDGVYERGEFYLRWLQRLSSAAFGTRTGRFLTRYAAIPFGGAYVLLSGIDHLVGPLSAYLFGVHIHTMNPASFLALAFFLLAILNVAGFRALFTTVLHSVYRGLRSVLVEFPRWLIHIPVLRDLMRSAPVRFFRRHLLTPLGLTAAIWFLLPQLGTDGRPSWSSAVVIFLSLVLVLNSRAGREIEEITAERIGRFWHLVRVRLFVALYDLIMDTFKQVLEVLERAIYEVDEWLRFKSGQSRVILAAKAVLGLCWAAVAFVVRIYVTLLIEPQVNPIKHFPVVTVSHKIILPLTPVLTKLLVAPLEPILGKWIAYTVVGATVFLLPGIFGFLVWELKENWRLYAANRSRTLLPVPVGHHGESIARLLKPGLHSGTIPKLYQRIRRSAQAEASPRSRRRRRKFERKLEHTTESVEHFVAREFVALLEESRLGPTMTLSIGDVKLGTNHVAVSVLSRSDSTAPLRLAFEEQSGWIVASLIETGWLDELPAEQRDQVGFALLGLFKKASVDLLRSRIECCFAPDVPPYDIVEDSLVVWPDGTYETEVAYPLKQRPAMIPRPWSEAQRFQLPILEPKQVLFTQERIAWEDWAETWSAGPKTESPPRAVRPANPPTNTLVRPEADPL